MPYNITITAFITIQKPHSSQRQHQNFAHRPHIINDNVQKSSTLNASNLFVMPEPLQINDSLTQEDDNCIDNMDTFIKNSSNISNSHKAPSPIEVNDPDRVQNSSIDDSFFCDECVKVSSSISIPGLQNYQSSNLNVPHIQKHLTDNSIISKSGESLNDSIIHDSITSSYHDILDISRIEVDGTNYYSASQSDKYRKLNKNFAQYKGPINNEPQYVTIVRTDETDFVSLHAIPVDDNQFETSYYTFLTLAIGCDADNNKIYFYVNPKCIAECMEYCRNMDYVCWGTFRKVEFDDANYEQCLKIIVAKTKDQQLAAKRLLNDSFIHKTFDPNLFYPVMYLGRGGFGAVLLVLKRLEDKTTTTEPCALKIQRVPKSTDTKYDYYRRGALYEPYFYSIPQHPNILRMFDHFELGDSWRVLLFEFLPYGTLSNFIEPCEIDGEIYSALIAFIEKNNPEKQFEPIKLIRFFTAQILMALEYLHELEIIHFDLKPNNIGIGYRGYLKVYDFGLSYHQKEIKYTYEMGLDFTVYGCKEKQDSIYGETTIGFGTDIYAFSITLLQMFGNLMSSIRFDMEAIRRKNKIILENTDETKRHDLMKEYFELSTQLIKKFVDLNEIKIRKFNRDPEITDMQVVFFNSFHFDDHRRRKSAKELLNLNFYNQSFIDKTMLLKQKYNLEEELNIDLRDLFVFTYSTYDFSSGLGKLGQIYEYTDNWTALVPNKNF